jgi:adenosine deaminase
MQSTHRLTKVSPILADRLRAMPKAEIHVHIEGATSAETFYQIAKQNQLKLPVASLKEWQSFFQFRNFSHFIEVYVTAVGLLQKPEDYAFAIEQFCKRQAEQNILYTEAFLSASFLTQKFNTEEIFEAIAAGIDSGQSKYNCRVQLIPDISREIPDSQTRVLDFVLQGKERGLFVGIGLGGIETGFPPQLFVETFTEARRQGLKVVAHAGEVEGANSIWGAIEHLRAERIGHGIRCLDDPNLVEFLKQHQIPVEVSPQSNYCLGVVECDRLHPLRQMLDRGIFCTVNSDDPAMFSSSLTDQYLTLAAQGFSWRELWQLNLNTLEATFLSETEKVNYRDRWQTFFNSQTDL